VSAVTAAAALSAAALSAAANQSSSCKFSPSDGVMVGSPQDLSRLSDVEGAQCQQSSALGPKTPDTSGSSQPTSPASSSKDDARGSATSGNRGSSSSGGRKAERGSPGDGKSSTNPPQIYPWMKRVHLGQSK
jgi:Antp family protein